MKLVVLGAAGGVGRQAVRIGTERGHTVVAAARRPAPALDGVVPVTLDVRDTAAVADILNGAGAVLWCVGVTRRSGPDVGRVALPGVVEAMTAAGVRRLVTVSGAGVTVPGDAKGAGARFVSALTRRFAADLVADKAGEQELLVRSTVTWTTVRPPRLKDAPPAGAYELTTTAPGLASPAVSRADVALALVELAENNGWMRQSPFLISKS